MNSGKGKKKVIQFYKLYIFTDEKIVIKKSSPHK